MVTNSDKTIEMPRIRQGWSMADFLAFCEIVCEGMEQESGENSWAHFLIR